MPAKTPPTRGTSPSPSIDRAAKTSWGSQKQAGTSAKEALAKKFTDNPVPVSGNKS